MKMRRHNKVLFLAFLMGVYFIPAADAAFWDAPKKEEKKQVVEVKKEVVAEAKTETAKKADSPALASATAPAPSLELISPKEDAVTGKFHVAAKLTPDEGFDQLFFRVMGDAVCEKDFNRGDKYEADCDTGKVANGTSFVLQAQAFNKSSSKVVASFSKVLWVGKAPAPVVAAPPAKEAVKEAKKVEKELVKADKEAAKVEKKDDKKKD